MIQLFLIIAFVIGLAIGWKVCELVIAQGIVYLSTKDDSGVKLIEDGNKLVIDTDLLKNFNLNKENIN
jgi:hypothetical protein